jgi:transposase InsO family protein
MAQNNDGNESRNDVKRPRRRYSAEEKRRLLDETVKPGESVSTVARRYNVALLERSTGDGRGRKHDGVIMTLKPNLRWCSDSFEIRCWSGERVNVAFVLDSCDREVTGFVAEAGPLCGEHVRDMMVQAVEHRFGPETRKLRIPLHSISRSGRIRSGFRGSDQASERSDEYGAGQAAGWVSGWGFRPFWRRMDEPRRVST